MCVKFRYILFSLVILIGNSAFSQKKMTLHFKDETSKTGFVTFKKKELKFQEKLKGKKKKIAYELLDSISSYVNPRAKRARAPKTVYVLPTAKEDKQYRVYEKVTQGKVTLYKYSSFGGYSGMWVPSGGGPGNSVYIPTGGTTSATVYGLKREGESYVSILGNSDSSIMFVKIHDSFKSQGSKYFSDCPILAEKIKNKDKGFTKKDIKKVVNYYNTQCNKN